MILTIRNFEFLNLIFLYKEEQSIILKYSKKIIKHLEFLMLMLSYVDDFDCKTYLPVGVITALVGSLFGNLMRFYHDGIYKNIQQFDENLAGFRSDTNILRNLLMIICVKLSKKCNSCIHELVLQSLSNHIVYLELAQVNKNDLFDLCSNLINSHYYPIEISAYNILDRFVS